MNKTFTVFTPTYNRAHTLHRVFDSLLQQCFRDFEWLIIDDGSTDHTAALVESWKQKAFFPIRYYYQTNQGKHIAFNRAVKEAESQFFVPLDSDDACLPEALERFLALWNNIPGDQQTQFSGICVLCQDQVGRLVGDTFPKDIFDSNSCELYYKYGIKGEKWGFHRTEVLRKYPFPEMKGVHFIPENIIWHAIAKRYQIRCVNEALRIYFIESNSLSTNTSNSSNRKAKLEYYRWVLKNDLKWSFYAPMTFVKYLVQYLRYSFG